jgi:hypothetical protein
MDLFSLLPLEDHLRQKSRERAAWINVIAPTVKQAKGEAASAFLCRASIFKTFISSHIEQPHCHELLTVPPAWVDLSWELVWDGRDNVKYISRFLLLLRLL